MRETDTRCALWFRLLLHYRYSYRAINRRSMRRPTHSSRSTTAIRRGSSLSERKGERLDAGIEKLNFEQPVVDRSRLPEQLIEPLFCGSAVPLLVHVAAVRVSRRTAIEKHAEAYRRTTGRGTHHQMQVARVKSVNEAPVC